MLLPPLFIFYLKRIYQSYPIQSIGMGIVIAAVSFMSGLIILAHHQTNAAHESRMMFKSVPSATVLSLTSADVINLPPLRSAAVVKTINSIAEDMHVPLEEVGYVLDGTGNTPYLRYRITVTTKVSYGEIRKFLAALSYELPNAALDTIHCTRVDGATAALGCDLAFSVFFSKVAHG